MLIGEKYKKEQKQMDKKRKLIRGAIKEFLLKNEDSIYCLIDLHIAKINSNINFDNEIKVSPAEIVEEIVLLEQEGVFEKDKNDFKYYVKGDISNII